MHKREEFLCQPDPFILEADGRYYIYATNSQGVTLYRTNDLKEWTYCGFCLQEEGMKEFWAPSVFYCDGRYFMYYSCVRQNTQDMHEQALRVACAESPEGPFRFCKQLIRPFSIDSQVFRYGDSLYILYSDNRYDGARVGTRIVLDKLIDPFTAEGNPKEMIAPTVEEEVSWPSRDFGDGKPPVKWHTVEGGTYFAADGVHYITYSGSAFQNDKYFVGYAVSRDAVADLRDAQFVKHTSKDGCFAPLLFRTEETEGTGHNSILRTHGETYIVYHARNRTSSLQSAVMTDCAPEEERRTLRINRLLVHDGTLTLGESVPITIRR